MASLDPTYLDNVEASLKRMQALIERLLDFTRAESKELTMSVQDLNDLVRKAIGSLNVPALVETRRIDAVGSKHARSGLIDSLHGVSNVRRS